MTWLFRLRTHFDCPLPISFVFFPFFLGFKNRCSDLTLFQVLRYMPTRRAFFISCGLQMFQQLVGINTVMYYSASIISMAGIGSHLKWKNRDKIIVWMSAAVAFANFAFCSLSPFLIARFRRRTLLLCSLAGVFFSLIFLGISFQLIASYSSPVTISEAVPVKIADHLSQIDCSRAYVLQFTFLCIIYTLALLEVVLLLIVSMWICLMSLLELPQG